MAAKKSSSKSSSAKKRSSSSKKDATKTPKGSSQLSKAEVRRPAPTIGDTAGAEFNPARTPEGERVAQTGANPRASRAGVIVEFPVPSSSDDEEGLGGLKLLQIDGSRAVLQAFGKESRPLTQADLRTFIGTLEQVSQGTT